MHTIFPGKYSVSEAFVYHSHTQSHLTVRFGLTNKLLIISNSVRENVKFSMIYILNPSLGHVYYNDKEAKLILKETIIHKSSLC